MKKLLAALVLSALLATSSCSPRLFQAVLVTAAVIGTVAVLAHHDAHFHDEWCGHHRRWHDGRWIYDYRGHWEWYDPATGTWYYYAE